MSKQYTGTLRYSFWIRNSFANIVISQKNKKNKRERDEGRGETEEGGGRGVKKKGEGRKEMIERILLDWANCWSSFYTICTPCSMNHTS